MHARSDITTEEARLLAIAVVRLRRSLLRGIRADSRWEALPIAYVELLQCLVELPGQKIGQVAKLLRLAPNTVSTVVAQLTVRGLVETVRDPNDGRARVIQPTRAGYQQLAQWQRAHESMIVDAVSRLPEGERSALLTATPALASLSRTLDEL